MPSLSITVTVAQLDRVGQLLDLLTTVPDPRDPRGVRYQLAGVLAVKVFVIEWLRDGPGGSSARVAMVNRGSVVEATVPATQLRPA